MLVSLIRINEMFPGDIIYVKDSEGFWWLVFAVVKHRVFLLGHKGIVRVRLPTLLSIIKQPGVIHLKEKECNKI